MERDRGVGLRQASPLEIAFTPVVAFGKYLGMQKFVPLLVIGLLVGLLPVTAELPDKEPPTEGEEVEAPGDVPVITEEDPGVIIDDPNIFDDPDAVIYSTTSIDNKRNNEIGGPVTNPDSTKSAAKLRKFQGVLQGTTRRPNSGLIQFSVSNKGKVSGKVKGPNKSVAIAGTVGANGVVMARLTDGSLLKARLQQGIIRGRVSGKDFSAKEVTK